MPRDRRYRQRERLKKKSEIDRVLRNGTRAGDRLMRIFALASDRSAARLTPGVPGRLCGAVERNRWKRLLRESFRLNKGSFGRGVDIVVMPNRPPGRLKRDQVERSLLSLYRRVKPGP